MNKFAGLMAFFVILNVNLFSVEIGVTWNKKTYDMEPNGLTYRYDKVSEVEFNTTVTVFLEIEELNMEEVIFRLYYDEDIMIFQKTISVWKHYIPDYKSIAVECEIITEREYLKEMKPDDTLYYKCSLEFPSGEIFESEPVKAIFTIMTGVIIRNIESMEFADYNCTLKSDDNEYYGVLNFKEDGFLDNTPRLYGSKKGIIFNEEVILYVKFEDLIPGKTYTLYHEETILVQGMPFHFLLFI